MPCANTALHEHRVCLCLCVCAYVSHIGIWLVGLDAGNGAHPVFVSKEMVMAAACRKVAVSGFDPIPGVFSLKRW